MNTTVVVDFELANSDPSSVCAAAFVVSKSGQVLEVWDAVVQPPGGGHISFSPDNVSHHGITEYDVTDGLDWRTVYAKLNQRLHPGVVLVADGGVRASQIIDAACSKAGLPEPHFEVRCIQQEAKIALPSLASHDLGALADYFGVPVDSFHRARSDALVTSKVHEKLLDELAPITQTLHTFVIGGK